MFWIGFLLYVLSFFAISVGLRIPSSTPDHGYESAVWSVFFAFADIKSRLLGDHPDTRNLLEAFSLLASSLINVFFLFYVLASRIWRQWRGLEILGFLIVLMIPFCWIVFHYESMYPREGHFVWISGMLLTIISNKREPTAA